MTYIDLNAVIAERGNPDAFDPRLALGYRFATIAAGFMPFVLGAVFWWAL